jgi:hypothetical protein
LALSALAVASSAAFFSVYGLAQIFSASFIPVIIMGASLEVGKLVAASFLYRFWKETPRLLRTYFVAAVFTLMVVTSLGIFGFLTAAYQTDSIGLKQQQEQIQLYEDQKRSYQERLNGINDDIARTGDNYITKRMELIDLYDEEKSRLINNIEETDSKILELRGQVLMTEAKIGPIIYVAEVLGENPDKATFWFVLIIIGVFDPLAIGLTLATNIALRKRQIEKEQSIIKETIDDVVEHAKHDIDDITEHAEHRLDEVYAKEISEDSSTSLPEDDLLEIKKMIRDHDNTDKIEQMFDSINNMEKELRQGRVRDNLNKATRK